MMGRPVGMPVKFKRLHPLAVLPKYSRFGDAGMDLTAVEMKRVIEGGVVFFEYGFGIAVEIPYGFEGQIRPRSSISDTDLLLTNSPGTIDAGYRGEIRARFKLIPSSSAVNYRIYEVGERIAQMIISPIERVSPVWAEELSASERGYGGYGSTDRTPCPECGQKTHAVNCGNRWTGEEA